MHILKRIFISEIIVLGLFFGMTLPAMALEATTESLDDRINRMIAEEDIRRAAMTAEERAEYIAKSLASLKKISEDIASGKKIEDPIEVNAKQGDANSQYLMGATYFNGYGKAKDYKKAFEWYQKAANQGLASSQNNLGFMYGNGLGVRQDYKKAFEWYQKAANQGDIDGQNNLGRVYLKGNGVRQDKAKAKELFGKTCDAGNQAGCDNYRLLNQ